MLQNLASSSREHQQWRLLHCDRIVLAALPQLCLIAEYIGNRAQVHMWHKKFGCSSKGSMMFRLSARADSYVRIGSLSPDLCHSTFTSNPVHWKHSPYFLQELIRLLVVAPSDVRCQL